MKKAALCLGLEGNAGGLMKRIFIAVLAGLLCWAAFGSLLIGALRLFWPAYEAVHPTRDFAFPMLLARLAVGAVATVAAGALVKRVAGTSDREVAVFGGLLLLVSMFDHLQEPTWSNYPLWYHLVFLGYLLPLTWLGGRFGRRG
jgi:hypothetical protein